VIILKINTKDIKLCPHLIHHSILSSCPGVLGALAVDRSSVGRRAERKSSARRSRPSEVGRGKGSGHLQRERAETAARCGLKVPVLVDALQRSIESGRAHGPGPIPGQDPGPRPVRSLHSALHDARRTGQDTPARTEPTPPFSIRGLRQRPPHCGDSSARSPRQSQHRRPAAGGKVEDGRERRSVHPVAARSREGPRRLASSPPPDPSAGVAVRGPLRYRRPARPA
jgi:hypothetical protein